MEKVWQNAASHTNFVKEGPLTDRLRTWTFKGFWLGMAAAYADVIFITQSLSFKTNLARYLYIVPPITVLPASYLVSREMLSAMTKDENSLWPYIWAAAAPASIWTTFRGRAHNTLKLYDVFKWQRGVDAVRDVDPGPRYGKHTN